MDLRPLPPGTFHVSFGMNEPDVIVGLDDARARAAWVLGGAIRAFGDAAFRDDSVVESTGCRQLTRQQLRWIIDTLD